jgi:hypothetical protein
VFIGKLEVLPQDPRVKIGKLLDPLDDFDRTMFLNGRKQRKRLTGTIFSHEMEFLSDLIPAKS